MLSFVAGWKQRLARLVSCSGAGASLDVANNELREELKDELRAEIRAELKDELRAEIRAELKDELRAEIRAEILAESEKPVSWVFLNSSCT